MSSATYQLSQDGLVVEIVISETPDGDLRFDLNVLTETGVIGDLNAIFLDIADASLLSGLEVSGVDVTGEKIKEDGVTKIDNFTNVNGEVVNDLGKFDLGVQFGTQGISTDDIQSTSFVLSHPDVDLSLSLFDGLDSALRLTSVGEVDGSREDSLKIGGTLDALPEPEPEIVNTAVADVLQAGNAAGFDGTETLTNGADSVLANDTSFDGTDEFVYAGSVTNADGSALGAEPLVLVGSDGGLLQVFADGSVDFSANGDFDSLPLREQTTTTFTYTIDGGVTGTVTVEVIGEMDSNPDGEGTGGRGDDGTRPDDGSSEFLF